MSQDSGRSGRQPPATPDQHHISSIAHLFFAEEPAPGTSFDRDGERQLAIACFNDSRIAAVACAELVNGARRLAAAGSGRRVRLIQEPGLTWSAHSCLGEVPDRQAGSRGPQSGHWLWPGPDTGAAKGTTVCWTQLQTGGERTGPLRPILDSAGAETGRQPVVAPGRDGLVACFLAREVGALGPGVALGRLLGQLAPQFLEILVFPDEWAPDGRRGGGGRRWLGRSADGRGDLLARCRQLTRALGGNCLVTITTLPGGGGEEPMVNLKTALAAMSRRLVGDFWLDPDS